MAKKRNEPTPSERLQQAVNADHREYVWDKIETSIWRISDRSNPSLPLHVYVDTTLDEHTGDPNFRVQYRNGIDTGLCPAGQHADPEDAMKHAEKLYDEVLASR